MQPTKSKQANKSQLCTKSQTTIIFRLTKMSFNKWKILTPRHPNSLQ